LLHIFLCPFGELSLVESPLTWLTNNCPSVLHVMALRSRELHARNDDDDAMTLLVGSYDLQSRLQNDL